MRCPSVARDRWHRAWPAIDGTVRGPRSMTTRILLLLLLLLLIIIIIIIIIMIIIIIIMGDARVRVKVVDNPGFRIDAEGQSR